MGLGAEREEGEEAEKEGEDDEEGRKGPLAAEREEIGKEGGGEAEAKKVNAEVESTGLGGPKFSGTEPLKTRSPKAIPK